MLGWLTALPWRNPVMLGAALSFVMLGFGGAGGLINMSYQLNATVHNTQWITGHFHLIFGGAIVIMYFVIAYDIWPHLTGRALDSFGLMRAQLWTWFVGMIVLTFPWHWVGILGMPRRMAFYDYANPAIAAAGCIGDDVRHRRRDPRAVRRAVSRGAGARADGAADRAGGLPLQRRGTPAARVAGCAQRLRAVARPDGGPDHRELRLSDRAFPRNARHGGSGHQSRRAVMSRGTMASLRNPWFTASVGITVAIALVAAVIGFIWLPLQHPGERFNGVWDAICTAAGLVRNAPSGAQIVRADYLTTNVEVVPQMLSGASAESIGRGATLALRCTMCHGARGLSQANTPNLAGQYPITIYKQLVDFKTGARASAVMAPLVADLSDADMRDLAAYYAYLPRVSDRPPTLTCLPAS